MLFLGFQATSLHVVVLNGETSNLLPVTSGVPQGSVLAPLLFLLYVMALTMWFCPEVQN